MKLIFVLPMLTGVGGIQTSLLNLLNSISGEGFEIVVCAFSNRVSPTIALPKGVTVVVGPRILEYCLADFRQAVNTYPPWRLPGLIIAKTLQRILGYRRILHWAVRRFVIAGEFDVAVAYANDIYGSDWFVGGANDIVRRCVSADRKIAWIHNDPTRQGMNRSVCEKTYAEFDAIVNVSQTCKSIFDSIAPSMAEKSYVVYNMRDRERVREMAEESNPLPHGVFNLVTVARLDNQQKRIDRIMDACAELKRRGFEGFVWHIIGDGGDRKWLEDYARACLVDDVVVFAGHCRNPYPYIKNSNVFVLTSDYEAQGIVLDEAMILNVPVIATSFAAAHEFVDEGSSGLLVEPTVDSLAGAISTVMRDPRILGELREKLALAPAPDNVVAIRQFLAVIRKP